jgi:hypothetical protein
MFKYTQLCKPENVLQQHMERSFSVETFVQTRVVSHIPKFGDASKSPSADTACPAGDAASLSEDAIVSHWRYIISFRDAHPPRLHPHLP